MIKKRKGWFRHIKPSSPVCPRKPERMLKRERLTILYEHCGSRMNLSEIPLPEGKGLADIQLSASGDEDGDITLEFYTREEYEEENPHYEREMKHYKAVYAKYEQLRDEFKAELAEWKAWNAEQDAADVKERLEAAERLLRQHGRLPGGPSVG
jgi:hypothetical protein